MRWATIVITAGLAVGTATAGRPAPPAGDPLQGQIVAQPLGHELPHAIYVSTIEGVDRSTTVDATRLSASGGWSPDTDTEVPVTVLQAVESSRAVLRSSVREPSKWGVQQIALEQVNKYWLYVVRWRPLAGGTKDLLQVPVLLSGRAVPPDTGGGTPK
jgi:hypothetical protein